MATVVEKTGIRRAKGWLYFLDKRGDVSRARMARGGGKGPKGREKVVKVGEPTVKLVSVLAELEAAGDIRWIPGAGWVLNFFPEFSSGERGDFISSRARGTDGNRVGGDR